MYVCTLMYIQYIHHAIWANDKVTYTNVYTIYTPDNLADGRQYQILLIHTYTYVRGCVYSVQIYIQIHMYAYVCNTLMCIPYIRPAIRASRTGATATSNTLIHTYTYACTHMCVYGVEMYGVEIYGVQNLFHFWYIHAHTESHLLCFPSSSSSSSSSSFCCWCCWWGYAYE